MKERQEYDILRTEELKKFGIKVIRFTNEEIENNMVQVLAKIKSILD